MLRVLIVAYGNPMRSDDGVAWRAADILAEKCFSPTLQILRLHQLAPELADTLRGYDRVIFIDAAFGEDPGIEPGSIQVEGIAAEVADPASFTHAFSPRKILALGADLYASRPQAFSVTVKGANFDHGSELSASVANALPSLISTIERLVSKPEPKP